MSEPQPMPVILCWHMHQPQYREAADGSYRFPWTYLHAVKDYVDMAAHLEAEPAARAVVNFAPVLLEQIEDYSAQLRACFDSGCAITDPLLAALAAEVLPGDQQSRINLIGQCLRANEKRIIQRFPAYARLAPMGQWLVENPESLMYASEQFLADLLVWYHLGWLAETLRRSDARVQALQDQAHGYTLHNRRQLLRIVMEMLQSVIPRYRALAASGRVELAMSPYAHPILPLLLDLNVAAEAQPDAVLPARSYPGGGERAQWHVRYGRAVFERFFGTQALGCWPSEGALSNATLQLLSQEGFAWTASGESVLRHSRAAAEAAHSPVGEHACRHRVYRVGGNEIACFFRDDGLSDLIGFSYADWHAEDAVANLLHHIETIAAACSDHHNCAISIILDGENAWEYYPENAYYFLSTLYRKLAAHPHLKLSTFSDFLRDNQPAAVQLPALVAGSWVYGTLSTWIGSADKNRGWDMLIEAKEVFDRVLAANVLTADQAERARLQLAVCEGSDWFWWFGDYNPAQTVSDFERLFRAHLTQLYQLLDVAAPACLAQSFTHGSGAPVHGGVMRQADTSDSGA